MGLHQETGLPDNTRQYNRCWKYGRPYTIPFTVQHGVEYTERLTALDLQSIVMKSNCFKSDVCLSHLVLRVRLFCVINQGT